MGVILQMPERDGCYTSAETWYDEAKAVVPARSTTSPAGSATRRESALDEAVILDEGVDKRGRFRPAYQNDELDASLVLIPILGFLPPDDERVKATVLAIAEELTEDDLVPCYRADTSDTGFEGKEGTFTICLWWLVTTRAPIVEEERARTLGRKLLAYAGPLHLYAEAIDTTTDEDLGNSPQAFTHLALIDAVGGLIETEERSQGVGAVAPTAGA
jgi:alpha,alpha-trehalase